MNDPSHFSSVALGAHHRFEGADPVRRAMLLALSGSALSLAGCVSSPNPFSGAQINTPSPVAPPAAPATLPTIGQGSIPGALILPLSASGNAGRAAQSMRGAVEMAISEFQSPDVTIHVFDDQGTPQGAQIAAQQAMLLNVQFVLGPLFAPAVQAVAQILRPVGVPMIAFSTDETVASRGVYLLSFLPSTDVSRIISYAASQQRKNVAALLPDDAYGTVVDGELRARATPAGARIVALERYPLDRAKMQEPIRRIIPALKEADALFIPDGSDAVALVLESLRTAQAPLGNLKLLGTGRWDDPRLFNNTTANGAWFAAPDVAGFQQFAQRFRTRFGNNDPARTASLAYDATLLVAALARQQSEPTRYSEAALTNSNGFAGIDGIFRFNSRGLNERGLAVLEVRRGAAVTISPAPRSFGGATG